MGTRGRTELSTSALRIETWARRASSRKPGASEMRRYWSGGLECQADTSQRVHDSMVDSSRRLETVHMSLCK